MRVNYILFIIFLSFKLTAQINSVSYDIKFNKKSKLFEAYLVIEDGKSSVRSELVQFNSQFSVFTPENSQLNIVKTYLPYSMNNQGQEVLGKWKIGSKVEKVPIMNNSNIYSITPELSPLSYYKELKQGHKYLLFTFSVSPTPSCDKLVKLYNNIDDHKDLTYNYKGGNFRNAFTIGGIKQKYNSYAKTKNVLEMQEIELSPIKDYYQEGETVEVIVENKNEEYDYLLSFSKSKRVLTDLVIENLKPENSGEYKIIATSAAGCKAEKDFTIAVKPQIPVVVEKPIIDKINIFPNPVHDNLNIVVSTKDASNIQANIFDHTGKLMRKNVLKEIQSKGELRKTIQIDFTSGLYFVDMVINGVHTKHPFIVIE
jgi:hypothetical protein